MFSIPHICLLTGNSLSVIWETGLGLPYSADTGGYFTTRISRDFRRSSPTEVTFLKITINCYDLLTVVRLPASG